MAENIFWIGNENDPPAELPPEPEVVAEIDPDSTLAIHQMYIQQVEALRAEVRSLTRLLGRLERIARDEGHDLRALVREETKYDPNHRMTNSVLTDPMASPENVLVSPFRTHGNDDLTDEQLVALAQVMNGELDAARDFRTLMRHVQTDDNMAAIWDQLLTMMRMLEGSDD